MWTVYWLLLSHDYISPVNYATKKFRFMRNSQSTNRGPWLIQAFQMLRRRVGNVLAVWTSVKWWLKSPAPIVLSYFLDRECLYIYPKWWYPQHGLRIVYPKAMSFPIPKNGGIPFFALDFWSVISVVEEMMDGSWMFPLPRKIHLSAGIHRFIFNPPGKSRILTNQPYSPMFCSFRIFQESYPTSLFF